MATAVVMHKLNVLIELSHMTLSASLRAVELTSKRVRIQEHLEICANSMLHHATSSTAALETLPVHCVIFLNQAFKKQLRARAKNSVVSLKRVDI